MKFVKRISEDVTKTMTAKENTGLIHFACVGYFYMLALSSLSSLLFIAFPAIYRDEESYFFHMICSVFIFINMIGNQILGAAYRSYYTNGRCNFDVDKIVTLAKR